LEPYRAHLIDIDLRWGVTRDRPRATRLGLCLDQIDECRSFFLGLLGQRYGWIPVRIPPETLIRFPWLRDHPGRSVTELEFLHAALNDPTRAGRVTFCFRAPEAVTAVPVEFRSVYVEPDAAAADRLRDLAERIRQSGLPLLDGYPAVWNADAGRFDELEAFGQFVQDQLWEGIRAELALPAAPSRTDPLALASEDHERFMESRLRVYVGREDVGRAVQAFADGGSPHACLITGPSGSGKSAALARFVADFRRRHPFATTLVHFVGAGPHSTNLREMLGRLCRLLRARLGFADEIPDEAALSPRCCEVPQPRAGAQPRPARHRRPRPTGPGRPRTTSTGCRPRRRVMSALSSVAHRRQSCPSRLRSPVASSRGGAPLGDVEQREIIRAVPSLSARRLDDEQVRLLLDNPATAGPLYLLVALEELRGFGSFEQLTERVRSLRAGTMPSPPCSIRCSPGWARVRHGTGAVRPGTAGVGGGGLSERELRELVAGEPGADDLFPVLRQLRSYLLDRAVCSTSTTATSSGPSARLPRDR
jgi:hypothetical protein